MAKEDILRDLRTNFMRYWGQTIGTENLQLQNERLGDLRDERKSSQVNGKPSSEERRVVADTLEVRECLQSLPAFSSVVNETKNKLSVVIDKLNNLCEDLQIMKLRAFPHKRIPNDVLKLIKLLTYEMFSVVLGENSKFKVQWYAHLLFQTKFINSDDSIPYRDLLGSFRDHWQKLIVGSRNREKMYVYKLMGFVSHIDAKERYRGGDHVGAPADARRALNLYNKAENWLTEDAKAIVTEDAKKIFARYNKVECPEGTVGSSGGTLSKDGFKLEIDEGTLKEPASLKIDASIDHDKLDKDIIPISPTMHCEGLTGVPATVEMPVFCSTNSDEAIAVLLAQDEENSKWEERGRKLLKASGDSSAPQYVDDCGADAMAPISRQQREKGGQVFQKVLRFPTEIANKFLVVMKETFTKEALYSLKSEVWYSADGNFRVVCSVDNKTVSETWEKSLRRDGLLRTKANIKPLWVPGNAKLSVQMKNEGSKVVVFSQMESENFTVNKDIAKHKQAHEVTFRLKMLPVGEEMLTLWCSVRHDTNAKVCDEWNLTWPDTSEGKIWNTFRREVIPSFKPDGKSDFKLWKLFVENALGIKLEDIGEEHRDHWIRILMEWQRREISKDRKPVYGREKDRDKMFQAEIREKTKEYREKGL